MAAEKKNLGRSSLADFEHNLPGNLEKLERQLRRGSGIFDYLTLGNIWAVPKKPHYEHDDDEVQKLGSNDDAKLLYLDSRLALEPSLYFACAEILWMWEFGPALELVLTEHW